MPRRNPVCTLMVWPDIHAPYHHEGAVATALAAAKVLQPDGHVILGDTWDCWLVSEYPKIWEGERRHATIVEELRASEPVIKAIARLPGWKRFTQGNHEFRFERYVSTRPELEGLVPYAKDLIPDTWEYTGYKQSTRVGKMHFSHDFGRHGIQAGRQGLQDLARHICFGHTHKLDVTYVGNHTALNCGWLGDPERVDYIHRDRARREYQHGFGVVDIDEKGRVWAQAVPIVGGETCMVRGKRVSA